MTDPTLMVMAPYAIYDTATGQIVRAGSGMKCDALAMVRPGQSVLFDNAVPGRHYVQAGALATFPAKPSDAHVWNWTTKTWAQSTAEADKLARAKREELLLACDWSQLNDVPAATKALWAPYRQAIRDMTLQAGYPLTIVWPTSPVA